MTSWLAPRDGATGRAWQTLAAWAVVLTLVSGCAAAQPVGTVAGPGDSNVATGPPSSATDPTEAPSEAPGALPSASQPPPTSRPTAKPATAVWSKPRLVLRGACISLTVSIDATGRYHVAAACGDAITYTTSSDGRTWKTTAFKPPSERVELDPQITLDGSTVYMAYSRLAPTDGGCGDDGLEDIGVYTRSRKLPDGAWSEPVRIGGTGDRVQSFRVVDGTLHLTITTDQGEGPVYYESQSGPVVEKVLLPEAVETSLRVGDDGRPRIAYATGRAIRLARVDGPRLSIETIADSKVTYLKSPSLVLGPGDRRYVVWSQTTDPGGGCVGPDPGPLDGTYIGVDTGGTWTTRRLSKVPGGSSLTLDPSSGRIDVIVGTGSLTHYASGDGETWTSKNLVGTGGLSNPAIRRNPADGSLGVVGIDWTDSRNGVYVSTQQ